ncbi:MAG: hypothetical protein IJ719_18345 [Clostridia bacterium]|nr:hypothetical protein [Clostridia bacterium]
MAEFGTGFGDNFKEDIVIKRSQVLPNIMYVLCWILIVMFGLSAFLMLQAVAYEFSVQSLVLLILCAGLAVLLFLFKDRVKVEYEYTFTNGTLDFARVYRSVKREELGSMNVRNVTACGHVAHQSFQRYLSMKDVDRKNWFLNRDGNLFYFYYVKENKKHLIIIEPSEEMVGMIRKCLDPGIYQG